jgi:hypothetical protein
MDVTTFTITVFCLIDDWLASQPQPLRQRGPAPTLADSEVLTIECVGEFLGIDTDSGLYQHFRRHWGDWFPASARCTAPPSSARRRICGRSSIASTSTCWPRSTSTRRSRWSIAWPCRSAGSLAPIGAGGCGAGRLGHDEVAKQTYLGLRAHLRVCWPGVIVDGRLAPANLSELAVGEELLAGVGGWTLADRNYGSPRLAKQLESQGGWLLAPPRGTRRSRQRPPPWLTGKRRRVETVIGQLTGRYQLKRVWARDAWHLWSRWLRKLLSHTMAVLLCQRAGLGSLRFADLITS